MASIAVTVEGVLRRVQGGSLIQPGLDVYWGLATRAKVILLTGEVDHEGLEYWLRSEGLNAHVRIIWSDVVRADLTSGAERLDQLSEARKNGHDIQLVIEPDPEVSTQLILAGYNVATFTHAEYTVPNWRPDAVTQVAAWADLADQVAHEAYLRVTDPRREENQDGKARRHA